MATMMWKISSLAWIYFSAGLVVSFAYASNCNIHTTSGKEFYLGIPYLRNTDGQPDFFIYVTSKYVGHVKIDFEKNNKSYRYVLNGALKISVPTEYKLPTSNRKEHNGIFLQSDVDVSVSLISQTPINYNVPVDCGQSLEGYLALPLYSLSTKHVIASYAPFEDFRMAVEVIVIATTDATQVSFTQCNQTCNTSSVTLDRLDSIMFNESYDLTGAVVESNKPVAVIAATNLAAVHGLIDDPYAQSLFEWIYPTEFAAFDFIIPNLPGRSDCVIDILPTVNNTVVTFHNNTNVTTASLYTYKVNQFLFTSDPVYVHADKPVLIYQYGTSLIRVTNHMPLSIYNSGAFVRYIPAIENYVNNATFVLQTHVDVIDNYLQVMVPANSSVFYDGDKISQSTASLLKQDQLYINDMLYKIVTLNLNVSSSIVSNLSSHIISSNNESQSIGVLLTGYGNGEYMQCAYGYPVAVQNEVCKAQISTITTTLPTQTSTTSTNASDIGPLCLECNDLSQLYLCEVFTRCQSDQICYVERYENAATQIRYRSGCIQKNSCSPVLSLCRECCHGHFCNINGCGATSLPPLGVDRGPLCLSCLHTTDVDSCQTLSYCDRDEVCMIEISSLFGSLQHYNMGCARKDCFSMDHRRSTTLCKSCCKEDFCNDQCRNTSSPTVPIIG